MNYINQDYLKDLQRTFGKTGCMLYIQQMQTKKYTKQNKEVLISQTQVRIIFLALVPNRCYLPDKIRNALNK